MPQTSTWCDVSDSHRVSSLVSQICMWFDEFDSHCVFPLVSKVYTCCDVDFYPFVNEHKPY